MTRIADDFEYIAKRIAALKGTVARIYFVEKGEEIRCENGHLVAIMAQDVLSSEALYQSQMDMKQSAVHGRVCAECSQPWCRGVNESFELHLSTGWRALNPAKIAG